MSRKKRRRLLAKAKQQVWLFDNTGEYFLIEPKNEAYLRGEKKRIETFQWAVSIGWLVICVPIALLIGFITWNDHATTDELRTSSLSIQAQVVDGKIISINGDGLLHQGH